MNKGNMGNQGDMGSKKKAGYEYLLAYKITVPIYDYTTYARQHGIAIWPKERVIREIREIVRQDSTLPDLPNFPNLPHHPDFAINLMITLIHQANYLIDKLIVSLKDLHMKKGGLTEELYSARKTYRGY